MHVAQGALEIRLKELTERHVASIRTAAQPRHPVMRTIAMMHELVMDAVGDQGLAPAGPLFARLHHSGDAIEIEAGMPLAQPIRPVGVVQASSLPGGTALYALLNGDRSGHEKAQSVMAAYAVRHGFGLRGAPWECFLVDERDTPIKSEWVTEIYLPVVRSLKPGRTPETTVHGPAGQDERRTIRASVRPHEPPIGQLVMPVRQRAKHRGASPMSPAARRGGEGADDQRRPSKSSPTTSSASPWGGSAGAGGSAKVARASAR